MALKPVSEGKILRDSSFFLALGKNFFQGLVLYHGLGSLKPALNITMEELLL